MDRSLRFKVFWRALAWAMLGLVVWLSLTPNPPQPPLLVWDKAQHALAYATLAGCFVLAWEGRGVLRWCLFLIAVGVALEYIQGWTGYRDFEYGDMLADAVGVAIGLVAAYTPLGRAFQWVERLVMGLAS